MLMNPRSEVAGDASVEERVALVTQNVGAVNLVHAFSPLNPCGIASPGTARKGRPSGVAMTTNVMYGRPALGKKN